jgi:hypothetical protein
VYCVLYCVLCTVYFVLCTVLFPLPCVLRNYSDSVPLVSAFQTCATNEQKVVELQQQVQRQSVLLSNAESEEDVLVLRRFVTELRSGFWNLERVSVLFSFFFALSRFLLFFSRFQSEPTNSSLLPFLFLTLTYPLSHSRSLALFDSSSSSSSSSLSLSMFSLSLSLYSISATTGSCLRGLRPTTLRWSRPWQPARQLLWS